MFNVQWSDILDLADELEASGFRKRLIWQLVDAGTSVGANHRACRQARSDREIVATLSVTIEEADESAFWLELIEHRASALPLRTTVGRLRAEVNSFVRILGKSRATVQARLDAGESKH